MFSLWRKRRIIGVGVRQRVYFSELLVLSGRKKSSGHHLLRPRRLGFTVKGFRDGDRGQAVAVATPAVVWIVSVTSFTEVLAVVFLMVVTDCPPTLIVSLVIFFEVLPTAWMVPVANWETPLDVLHAAVLQLAKNTDKSTTAEIGQIVFASMLIQSAICSIRP